jgi:hypothetical protein
MTIFTSMTVGMLLLSSEICSLVEIYGHIPPLRQKRLHEAVQLSEMLAIFRITTVITLNLTNDTLFRQREF